MLVRCAPFSWLVCGDRKHGLIAATREPNSWTRPSSGVIVKSNADNEDRDSGPGADFGYSSVTC